MEVTVTLDRTELELDPLEIVTTGCGPEGGNFWIPANSLSRPAFDMRRKYSPETVWCPPELLAAVVESSLLPLSVMVQADSPSELADRMAELEAATSQFEYNVTLGIDGISKTWQADPTLPAWGTVNHLLQSHNMVRGVLQIPVNPEL